MAIRVGVAGTGRLGREHVRVLGGIDGVESVACYDVDHARAESAAAAFGARACPSLEEMISDVDAVCVVVPTTHHARVASLALEAGRDVFVEKPLARSSAEAADLVGRAEAAGAVLQVGHVERFNGAVQAAVARVGRPSFVEIHRLAPFRVRGTDVSVVGDLMIHDLDLLGYLVGEWPVEVRAKGASILTPGFDIVNARLEFPGGCVANVTASRVTVAPMRKVRVFSPDGYLSIDLLAGVARHYRRAPDFDAKLARLREGDGAEPQLLDFVQIETIASDGVEPLRKELDAFCRCVATRETPPVTGRDGLAAVRLAEEVLARASERAAS
jgi:predicted dehydrogenase